jgi:hypothetical protein
MTTDTGKNPTQNEPTDKQYLPSGYLVGQGTLSQKPISYQPELASRDAVNAQMDGLKQHLDDSIKILKAELAGQIEMLRKDVNDLQTKKREEKSKNWDIKLLIIGSILTLVITGVGAVIGWLLSKQFGQ